MYKYSHFIKENIAPAAATSIGVYDNQGNKITTIPLGCLKQPDGEKKYSFLAISDVHIGKDKDTYTDSPWNVDFERALQYATENCDFTCICGDLTDQGSHDQLTKYQKLVEPYAKIKPVYAVGGNHDSIPENQTSERLSQYTGQPMYYSFEKGNDVFIMLSHYGKYGGDGIGWRPSEFVSSEELQWLYETLEANRNKRCFVFNHVYPYEDGVGDADGRYNGKYWLTTDGKVGQAYINLLKHYKNTILFHGHSHLRFWLQELDDKANYSDKVGYRSVHIPSLSVPREVADSYIFAESEGYVVDVYDDYIILNGRDFIDNDKDGHILPIATYKIDTKLVNIEPNTFIDSTGKINTQGGNQS